MFPIFAKNERTTTKKPPYLLTSETGYKGQNCGLLNHSPSGEDKFLLKGKATSSYKEKKKSKREQQNKAGRKPQIE